MQTSKPRPPRNFLGKSISGSRQTGQQCVRRQLLSVRPFQAHQLIVAWLRTMTRLRNWSSQCSDMSQLKYPGPGLTSPGYLRPWSVSAKPNNGFTIGLKNLASPSTTNIIRRPKSPSIVNWKRARWQYINNILCTSQDEGNHKPFWKYIRSQREDNVGVAPLKEDGRLQASHEAKCNTLAKQFK